MLVSYVSHFHEEAVQVARLQADSAEAALRRMAETPDDAPQ